MSCPAAPDSTSGTVPNTGGAVTQRVMGLPRTLTSPHIDIPELAQFFIQRFGGELSKRVQGLAAGAEKLLKRHNWPGNIRELENTIERAVLLAETHLFASRTCVSENCPPAWKPESFPQWLKFRRPASPSKRSRSRPWSRRSACRIGCRRTRRSCYPYSPRVMNYKIKTLGITLPCAAGGPRHGPRRPTRTVGHPHGECPPPASVPHLPTPGDVSCDRSG